MKNYGRVALKTKLLSGIKKPQHIRMEFFVENTHLLIQKTMVGIQMKVMKVMKVMKYNS